VGTLAEQSQLTGVDLSGRRSQEYQQEYRLNGAIYVAQVEYLLSSASIFTEQVYASVMPRIRSLDIDEGVDFRICEALIGD